MAEDISYTNGHQRFRYRAAAIIIEEGAICFMSSPSEDYHYSVGGAVQFGETTEEAVLREVLQKKLDSNMKLTAWSAFTKISFQIQTVSSEGQIAMKPKGKQFQSQIEDETVHWIPIQELENHRVFPTFIP